MSNSDSKTGDCVFGCVWACGVCVAVCRENAIVRGSCVFTIDKAACTGCRLCIRACPAGILEEDLVT